MEDKRAAKRSEVERLTIWLRRLAVSPERRPTRHCFFSFRRRRRATYLTPRDLSNPAVLFLCFFCSCGKFRREYRGRGLGSGYLFAIYNRPEMIGSFLTRALALVLGYAYPAYECFKTVELNRPEIEQLRFWCQYWILVAALTVFERVGDTFISWMPMYSEAKVAFFVYLWYPKTKGTTYIYETFLRPYVTRHETEIDRNLLELKARAGDMVFLYWQKAAMYGQTRIFNIFQFISFQPPQQQRRSRPTVQRHSVHLGHQTAPSVSAGNQAAASQKPLQPPRASPSPTKNKNQEPPGKASGVPPPVQTPQIQPSPGTPYQPSASANTSQTSASEGEVKQIATTAAEPASVEDSNLPAKETPIEEAIRMTRGRLRKRAGSFGPSSCQ